MALAGFDFGTTNSLVSLVRGGRAINFLDEEQRPIPSIACYEGARRILGREAKQRLSQAGLGVQGNIVRSPKMFLGRDSVFVEGIERSPVEIVSDVVGHVLGLAREQSKDIGRLEGAVVTIPVDMQGFQRRALRDAFKLAGLPVVQFVHEPLAALYGYYRTQDFATMQRRYDQKLILVFDWGGGTLDLTLCRPIDGRVVQLMNDGTDEVGGDTFDEAIMNRLIQNAMRDRGLGPDTEIHPGAKARLLDRCERAKIDLSRRSNVSIYLSNFFKGITEEEFDCTLDQSSLEEIVDPILDKGFKRIEQILERAGFSHDQVALCLATGGMSNMPAIRRRLHEWFGPERVSIPDGSATLIAEGAAWVAFDQSDLSLAKTVELQMARGSYLPLVKAGTLMPREGKVMKDSFHLYCTDPRDGFAKFQILAPKRSSSQVLPGEPRSVLGTMTVKVDAKARAFEERIELDITIDDDLILVAKGKSMNKRDMDRCEIHNLEFGLQFPPISLMAKAQGRDAVEDPVVLTPSNRGDLTVRANLADREDRALIPGELLQTYDPTYFDPRFRPPEKQVAEYLYYQPCALCGRPANDPECEC